MGDITGVLDYWEFTCPFHQADRLASVFAGGWTVRTKAGGELRGWRGYTNSADLAVGSGLVGWCPERPEMGLHCSLGGEALALLAGQSDAWRDLAAMGLSVSHTSPPGVVMGPAQRRWRTCQG